MALPSTFVSDDVGGGTWKSNNGQWKRYDVVAVQCAMLACVQSAGVDPRIHLDINMKVDHLVTQSTLHVAAAELPDTCSHGETAGTPVAVRAADGRYTTGYSAGT